MSNHNETLHILGIAPYDSMRDVMLRTAEGFPGLQLDVYIGDLEQGVNIVKNVGIRRHYFPRRHCHHDSAGNGSAGD